jgi:glycosyltransferase involved in cell wall biosynthesis
MLNGKKVVLCLPAYNAEITLERTIREVPTDLADLFIVVDDGSSDQTCRVAEGLASEFPIQVFRHQRNRGYGANQKTCYHQALSQGADIIVMLHPDYQYEPKLAGCLAGMVGSGIYDIGLGSRMLGGGVRAGGMPLYKYLSNRVLTAIENLAIGQALSEYHTGYRAYSRTVLETLPFEQFSDDFVFDNEFLVQAHLAGFSFGEISVPTRYFPEASSIGFGRSVVYGLGVLRCSWTGWVGRVQRKR